MEFVSAPTAIGDKGPISPQSSYADAGDIARAFEAELQEQEQERQSASKKNDQPDQSQASHGGWFDRGLGLLQAGFGVAETMAGVAFGVATAETGVGAAVGGAFALHGFDDIVAGFRRAGSGKPTETFTQQIAAGAAEKLGADPRLAVAIGIGVDLAAGGGVGGAEKAGVKALEEGGKLLKGGSKVLEDGGKLTQDGRKAEESLNGVSGVERAAQAAETAAFPKTEGVAVSGSRAIDLGASYEVGIRRLYGGRIAEEERRFTVMMDGKRVSGETDAVTKINGEKTAVDAKFVDNWATSLRNPASPDGLKPWAVAEQQAMVAQAQKYSAAFKGGVIYHTNSAELAAHYSNVFRNSGVANFKFVITPALR